MIEARETYQMRAVIPDAAWVGPLAEDEPKPVLTVEVVREPVYLITEVRER